MQRFHYSELLLTNNLENNFLVCHLVNYIFCNQCSAFLISRGVFTQICPIGFSLSARYMGVFVSSYLNKFWAFFLLYLVQYCVIFDCDMSRVYGEMVVVVVVVVVVVEVVVVLLLLLMMMIIWKHLANKPSNNGYP